VPGRPKDPEGVKALAVALNLSDPACGTLALDASRKLFQLL